MPITTLDDLKAFFTSLPDGSVILVRKEAGEAEILVEEPAGPQKTTSVTGADLVTALSQAVDVHTPKVPLADPLAADEATDPVVPA